MANATAIRGQVDQVIENNGSTVLVIPHTGYTRDSWGRITTSPGEASTGSNVQQLHHFNNSLIPETGVTPTSAGTVAYSDGYLGGRSLSLNGSDTTLSLGANYGLSDAEGTYALWFKPISAWDATKSTSETLFRRTKSADTDLTLRHSSDASGKLRAEVVTNPPLVTGTITTTPDVTAEWHHAVVSFSDSSFKLYYDGALVGSVAASLDVPNGGDNGTFYIGSNEGTADYFGGVIDELIIYDEQLTDAEVLALYTSQAGTSIKAVPDNQFSFLRQLRPVGELNGANTIIIVKGEESVNKEDLLKYNTKWYKVISVQGYMISDVDVAKEVGLEEYYDNKSRSH